MTASCTLDRDAFLSRIANAPPEWDVVVIGGGATGLGAAVDSASRGYTTLLLEQSDFGKGTSSRSTKLIHGGVRYLRQGNLPLVLDALKERDRLRRNAPHLVRNAAFVVPCYGWWELAYYGAGLKVYDRLARGRSFGRSKLLSRDEIERLVPGIQPEGLRGGVLYRDGQFDDSRLIVNLAQTAASLGAVVLNYVRVIDLVKEDDRVCGVVGVDGESGTEITVRSAAVINATGVFADELRLMDQAHALPLIRSSQGVHVVLDRSFLPGTTALMVPRTDDGRVLFAVPWHDRVIVGTTDTPVDEIRLDPFPFDEEIEFLLRHAGRYLVRAPARSDVLSTFAGLRPLVSARRDGDTASITRDHVLHVSSSGLITITGGKWTTYRKMAKDVVDKAAAIAALPARGCRTERLPIHGWEETEREDGPFSVYGSDAPAVERLMRQVERGDERIHPRLPYLRAEIHWAVLFEMARTVEDVLSRRTRALVLDVAAAMEAAPAVAAILATRLGRDEAWQQEEVRAFRERASGYLVGDGAVQYNHVSRIL